jgi:hypothetical protein
MMLGWWVCRVSPTCGEKSKSWNSWDQVVIIWQQRHQFCLYIDYIDHIKLLLFFCFCFFLVIYMLYYINYYYFFIIIYLLLFIYYYMMLGWRGWWLCPTCGEKTKSWNCWDQVVIIWQQRHQFCLYIDWYHW